MMSQLSVANIVAETMDNYLLLGHILRCKVLPSEEAHPDLWVGANRKYRAVPSVRLERARLEKPRTKDEQEKAERRLTKRQASKKAKLAELGIDYDLEPVSFVRPPPLRFYSCFVLRDLRLIAVSSLTTIDQKAAPKAQEA